MPLFIRNPVPNPNIKYAGKTLPRDKGQPRTIEGDPNIYYQGTELPAGKIAPTPFVDAFNTPGTIILTNLSQSVTLPPDSKISPLKGEKHIAMTNILDGVPVFEHIQRKAYKIEIEGTFRMQNKGGQTYNNTTPPPGTTGQVNNVFAQGYLQDVWNNAWLPNTVLGVNNTYLNGLGILQIIVESFVTTIDRGKKDIFFVLSAWENVVGQSLIIS